MPDDVVMNRSIEQTPANLLVDEFEGIVQGVHGPVALFNRSSHVLEDNPELSTTYTRTPDQVAEGIEQREQSKIRRADLVELQLVELNAARDALRAEGCEL